MNKIWCKIDKYHYIYNCKKTGIIYPITIGKNKYDNWKIIDEANDDDYWFHIEDCPSSHVIINMQNHYANANQCKKNDIDKGLIKFASWLCKNTSKKNDNEKIIVIYTQVKNLTKGKYVGTVVCSTSKKIYKKT